MNPYYNFRITSKFEKRINPISNLPEFHRGIDFAPNEKHETYAGISGSVRLAESREKEGNFVQIATEINKVSFYCNLFHNKKLLVNKGDKVKINSIVAISGSTGYSTGEHIHNEIFTYSSSDPFIIEIKKTVNFWYCDDGRLFFDPLDLYKFFDDKNINY